MAWCTSKSKTATFLAQVASASSTILLANDVELAESALTTEISDTRWGWTAGAGVDWAFASHWSANLEYDYYGFGTRTSTFADQANVFQGPVSVRQSIQVVKVGLNFHMWAGQ